MEKFGADFLKNKYDLHNTEEVKSAVERTETHAKLENEAFVESGQEGPLLREKVLQNTTDQIASYLDRFKEILDREDPQKRERGVEAIKRVLHDKFVIKPEEIPEVYFENQQRIARERGHGDIEITDEIREQLVEVIVTDQESSLDKWVDYLASSDAMYPDWLKYYAIRSVLGMGDFDKDKKQFTKRSNGTIKPFPDLNREALAYVLDAIEKKHKDKKDFAHFIFSLNALGPEEKEKFEKLIAGENFAKLYVWAIEQVTPASVEQLTVTEGEWVKYEQGSDHMPLVESLQGHGTGWCTAGESTAQAQLEAGDFYVYYSLDQDGKSSIPRVAIRMQEDAIAEVRGIAAEQNLDPYISPVVQEKMKEFPDGTIYEKKVQDMKTLTLIENKNKKEQELSKEELIFLYEIDTPIEGFGYARDPRIYDILQMRDLKVDCRILFERTNEIEDKLKNNQDLTREDLKYLYKPKSRRIKYLLDPRVEEFINKRDAQADFCTIYELPKSIHEGDLDFSRLTSLKHLALPKIVNGNVNLNNVTLIEDVEFPEYIKGDLLLGSIISVSDLVLPSRVEGDLVANKLTWSHNTVLPKYVGGNLDLPSLLSDDFIIYPKQIGGSLDVGLFKNGILPEYIGSGLRFRKPILFDLKDLVLPGYVGTNVCFSSKQSEITESKEVELLEEKNPGLDLVFKMHQDNLVDFDE